MALPVAVQVYSIRDVAEANFADTLRKVKEMGYDGVEFAGLYGFDPNYVKGLVDGIGLVPISAHIPLDDMLADPEKTFADYSSIGCKFAVVPYVTEERRPGAEKFEQTIADMKTGNYENALLNMESRINSPLMSDVIRGLIGVLRGDDQRVYFKMLTFDMRQMEQNNLKKEAMKRPQAMQKYCMFMMMCILLIYGVVLITEVVTNIGILF